MVFKFYWSLMLVMFLLLSQQSVAVMPIKCDDHSNASAPSMMQSSKVSSSHRHDHSVSSIDHSIFQMDCENCGANDCQCCDISRCLSTSLSPTFQTATHRYDFFIDHGNRFASFNQNPHLGIHLHPFRPPIIH